MFVRRLYSELPETETVATVAGAMECRFHVRCHFGHAVGLYRLFHHLLGDCCLEMARRSRR